MSWEDIPGWFAFRETYDEMIDAAEDGDTIVEVGVAFGRSIAYLARRAIDTGKKVRIVAVDPWRDDWWMFPSDYPEDALRPTWGGEYAEQARALGGPFRAFVHYMTQHAPEELERIDVMRCKGHEVARMGLAPKFVMIDGNHNYPAVLRDIDDWIEYVSLRGGILAGDDYHEKDFPGVVQAVRETFPGDGGFEVRGTTWIRRGAR